MGQNLQQDLKENLEVKTKPIIYSWPSLGKPRQGKVLVNRSWVWASLSDTMFVLKLRQSLSEFYLKSYPLSLFIISKKAYHGLDNHDSTYSIEKKKEMKMPSLETQCISN